ncbi:MAG TPA: YicC family protein [Clostridiales bacterium]|nr:YicC family protein [Clostridiales bacterium]
MKSMTGYGKYSIKNDYGELTIEIKSVNNRFLDINTHIPKSMALNEDQIRKCIQSFIKRGSVDVYFLFSLNADIPKPIELDLSAVSAYLDASKTLKEKYNLPDDFTTSVMLKLPDVLKVNNNSDIWDDVVIEGLNNCLLEYDKMRQIEGKSIQEDMRNIINSLQSLLDIVAKRAPIIVDEYREKIKSRIQEILKDYSLDEARLLNEVAFFADKADINEELSRMNSHIDQFSFEIISEECSGKKLDFILQEMLREVNTMCSKCNDIDVSKLLIEMKCQLEKLKEHTRNVE